MNPEARIPEAEIDPKPEFLRELAGEQRAERLRQDRLDSDFRVRISELGLQSQMRTLF